LTAPSGKLELTWTNKHLRLLADEAGGYTWVPPADYRVAEVRLLHDVGEIGQTRAERSRAKDNLLIRGDALNVLTTLCELPEFAREYVGKVKLAYLDPPFNTKQAFDHYDDALEHSVWLTMMRDRLLQIRKLLSPDGSVWVHCDDSEQPYLKVMMDEVMGRDSFLGCVVWKRRNDTRNTAILSANHDYIIVFARDVSRVQFNLLPRTEEMEARYSNPDNDPRDPGCVGISMHVTSIRAASTQSLHLEGV
jgi:adenine-specific DNA-methyltransferase